MERITTAMLERQVEALNRQVGKPIKAWKQDENGKFSAVVGCYVLSCAYGGWKLERIESESGGVSSITGGYIPKRELSERIRCYAAGLRAGGK